MSSTKDWIFAGSIIILVVVSAYFLVNILEWMSLRQEFREECFSACHNQTLLFDGVDFEYDICYCIPQKEKVNRIKMVVVR